VLTFDLETVPLKEMRNPEDGSLKYRVGFPVYAHQGAADCAVVWMQIEPGRGLGMHKDSQEESVLVLEGTARGTLGEETAELGMGNAVVIPAMVPHDLENVGEGVLKAVGFFSGASVVSTFEPAPIPGAQAMIAFHDRHGERIMSGSDLSPRAEP
jgi:mannose-6-phosphate isomerase-like protein (cupin superfamily)